MLQGLMDGLNHPAFKVIPEKEFEIGKDVITRMITEGNDIKLNEEEDLAFKKVMAIVYVILKQNGGLQEELDDDAADMVYTDMMKGDMDKNPGLYEYSKNKVLANFVAREDYERAKLLNDRVLTK